MSKTVLHIIILLRLGGTAAFHASDVFVVTLVLQSSVNAKEIRFIKMHTGYTYAGQKYTLGIALVTIHTDTLVHSVLASSSRALLARMYNSFRGDVKPTNIAPIIFLCRSMSSVGRVLA